MADKQRRSIVCLATYCPGVFHIFTFLITPTDRTERQRRHNEMADGHRDRRDVRYRISPRQHGIRMQGHSLNRYVNVIHVSAIRYGLLYTQESAKQTNVLSNMATKRIISGKIDTLTRSTCRVCFMQEKKLNCNSHYILNTKCYSSHK